MWVVSCSSRATHRSIIDERLRKPGMTSDVVNVALYAVITTYRRCPTLLSSDGHYRDGTICVNDFCIDTVRYPIWSRLAWMGTFGSLAPHVRISQELSFNIAVKADRARREEQLCLQVVSPPR